MRRAPARRSSTAALSLSVSTMPDPHALPDYMRLLPADAVARLGGAGILARGLVQGNVAGRHRSPYKGISVEFAEHRPYARGDDLRNLDWRIWGKSDRYYVKQYIEETNLRATLLVDASGSMQYAGTAAAKIDGRPASKFAYAQRLAAILAYIFAGQQDAVGLVTFDAGIRSLLPARNRSSQLRHVLEELHRTSPGDETALSPVFHDIAERIPRRGMVVVISDLFDEIEPLLQALHHFRYRKHEVMLLHVMADEELSFPFEQWTEFRCLETAGLAAQLDPQSIRAAYLQRIHEFLHAMEVSCGQMRIDYVPMNTKTSYSEALAQYLAHRRGN
jgi:uncharacterized protein (DUF58 family)